MNQACVSRSVRANKLFPGTLFVAWITACLGFGAAAKADESILFANHSPLEITLIGPFNSRISDLDRHALRPFKLVSHKQVLDIEARLQGHSRLRVCDFPPMLLTFSSAGAAAMEFTRAESLRLVTHCRNNNHSEQDTLEEYIAHRILNLLTEASYRVRLAHITYKDADSTADEIMFTRYGFLLEPHAQLAARIGARKVNLPGVPSRRQDLPHSALVFIFQYLIANTDWGMVTAESDTICCHNGFLFERDTEILFLPYDFDLSGLVNARYAYPDSSLRIKRVTQRLYRGLCTDREILRVALATVVQRKGDILTLLRTTPGLSPESRSRDERFINAFFKKADKQAKLLKEFEKKCL